MKHFQYFPKIEYSNNASVNMLVRSKIRDFVINESSLYYEYTLKDSDRPDIIATKYYGNPDYTWVLFYANEIKNPLTDWPLDNFSFQKYIIEKYGSIQYAYETTHHYLLDEKYIIDQKTFLNNNIRSEILDGNYNGYNATFKFAFTPITGFEQIYLNGILQNSGNDYIIYDSTIKFSTPPVSGSFALANYTHDGKNKKSVSIYEHENNLNEEKRYIKILDSKYISRIREEIRNIFK